MGTFLENDEPTSGLSGLDSEDTRMKNIQDAQRIIDFAEMRSNYHSVIVGLSGGICSGKDYMADTIKELIPKKCVKLSYGDPLKDEIFDMCLRALRQVEEFGLENLCHSVFLSGVALNEGCSPDQVKTLYSLMEDDIVRGEDSVSRSLYRSKNENTRRALQFWGTEVRRAEDEDYWVKIVEKQLLHAVKQNLDVVVSDVRFPNEGDLVKKYGGVVVLLDAPDDLRLQRMRSRDDEKIPDTVFSHVSETSMSDYAFDLVIR